MMNGISIIIFSEKIQEVSTAFFGCVKLHEEPSMVLVTGCHVLDSEAKAAASWIKFDGIDVQINLSELLIKNSFVSSDKKKVQIFKNS